jgi:hypothetical protein
MGRLQTAPAAGRCRALAVKRQLHPADLATSAAAQPLQEVVITQQRQQQQQQQQQ